MRRAPLLIVPLSDKSAYLDRYAEPDKGWTDRDESRWPVPYWDVDAGMAALLMLLTAVDEGLGACFFGVPPERIDAFRAAFGVPEDYRPVGCVSVGYPGTTTGAHRRCAADGGASRRSCTAAAGDRSYLTAPRSVSTVRTGSVSIALKAPQQAEPGHGDARPQAEPEPREVPVGTGEQGHRGGRRGQRHEQREDADEAMRVRRQDHQQPQDGEHTTAQHDGHRLPEPAPQQLAESCPPRADRLADQHEPRLVLVGHPGQPQAHVRGDAGERQGRSGHQVGAPADDHPEGRFADHRRAGRLRPDVRDVVRVDLSREAEQRRLALLRHGRRRRDGRLGAGLEIERERRFPCAPSCGRTAGGAAARSSVSSDGARAGGAPGTPE